MTTFDWKLNAMLDEAEAFMKGLVGENDVCAACFVDEMIRRLIRRRNEGAVTHAPSEGLEQDNDPPMAS